MVKFYERLLATLAIIIGDVFSIGLVIQMLNTANSFVVVGAVVGLLFITILTFELVKAVWHPVLTTLFHNEDTK